MFAAEREDFYQRLKEQEYRVERLVLEVTNKEEELKDLEEAKVRMQKSHRDEMEELREYTNKKFQSAIDDQKAIYDNDIANLERGLDEQRARNMDLENRVLALLKEIDRLEKESRKRTK